MRFTWLVGLLACTACSASFEMGEPVDAGADAALAVADAGADVTSPDATAGDAGGPDATVSYHGAVDIRFYEWDLRAHACGGVPYCLDGDLALDVMNPGSAAHVITITQLTVGTVAAPWQYYDVLVAPMPDVISVPAGASEPFDVPFDVSNLYEACAPGPFRIIVAFDVDGRGASVVIDPAVVMLDPGC